MIYSHADQVIEEFYSVTWSINLLPVAIEWYCDYEGMSMITNNTQMDCGIQIMIGWLSSPTSPVSAEILIHQTRLNVCLQPSIAGERASSAGSDEH